jgi:hypothetical protein
MGFADQGLCAWTPLGPEAPDPRQCCAAFPYFSAKPVIDRGFLVSPFPHMSPVLWGVWGLRPQRVQGRALAFLLA